VAILAVRLALALLQPAVCATADGLTVWIEDVDCGVYWEVCRTGEYVAATAPHACCLWANPEVCRLETSAATCNPLERHRCDGK
jgi:hypothetical protein